MNMLIRFVIALSAITAIGRTENIGWRGDGTGRYPDARPPQTWSKETNVAWKTALPGNGYALPVYCQGRLFLLAEPAHVLCLDADDGEVLWRQQADYKAALGEQQAAEIERTYAQFEREKRPLNKRHDELRKEDPEAKELEGLKQQLQEIDRRREDYGKQFPQERRGGAGNAAATPVCDGRHVYVAFGTGVVACFTLDGQPRWVRHLEAPTLGFGHSASPALAGGRLVVHYRDLVALDPATGKEVWRIELPAKHGSPVVAQVGGQDVLVTPSGALIEAANGRRIAEKLFDLSENSPLAHDGVIYAHESGKIKALKLPDSLASGTEVQQLWESSSSRDQRMASAVWHDGLLYAGGRGGILDVTDARTGEVLHRKRLEIGELFPSPAAAGDLVFISGSEGKTLVLRSGRGWEEVALNETDRSSSTPIFVGSRIYLRTEKQLYCIQDQAASGAANAGSTRVNR